MANSTARSWADIMRPTPDPAQSHSCKEDEALARTMQAEVDPSLLARRQMESDRQMAMKLQAQFDRESSTNQNETNANHIEASSPAAVEVSCSESTDSDAQLAQALQRQFDEEYNQSLTYRERAQNQNQAVGVSLANFRVGTDGQDEDPFSSRPDYYDLDSDDDWEYGHFLPKEGDLDRYGHLVTKHNPEIAAAKSLRRLRQLRNIDTGLVMEGECHIGPKAFNDLKQSANKLGGRSARIKGKHDRAVHEQVLDPKTRLALLKMINWGVLEEVKGVISTGKEATVFCATGGCNVEFPVMAIKVFKTTLNEFKNRMEYIKDDHRFREFLRSRTISTAKLITVWAMKEACNLRRLCHAGVPCPEPVLYKKNILVMSFIGKDQSPAPTLREAEVWRSKRANECWLQCVSYMHTMYNVCGLVHADYSEYNLLYQDGIVYVIDVGQAVMTNHKEALNFLYRDCRNMVSYFGRSGFPVPSAAGLFAVVTNLGIVPATLNKDTHLAELQESLATASTYLQAMDADLGGESGTVTLATLKAIQEEGQSHRHALMTEEEESERRSDEEENGKTGAEGGLEQLTEGARQAEENSGVEKEVEKEGGANKKEGEQEVKEVREIDGEKECRCGVEGKAEDGTQREGVERVSESRGESESELQETNRPGQASMMSAGTPDGDWVSIGQSEARTIPMNEKPSRNDSDWELVDESASNHTSPLVIKEPINTEEP